MRRVILLPLTLILWVVSFVLYLFGGFHWVVNLLKPCILGKTPLGGDNLYPIGIFLGGELFIILICLIYFIYQNYQSLFIKKKKKKIIHPTSGINLVSELIFRYQTPKPLPHQSLVKDCKLPNTQACISNWSKTCHIPPTDDWTHLPSPINKITKRALKSMLKNICR